MNAKNQDDFRNSATDEEFLSQIITKMGIDPTNRPMMDAVTFDDNPDEKYYLILLTVYPDSTDDTSDSYRDWEIKMGRQATYDYLKDMIKSELIDPNTSFIIAGSSKEERSKENFKPDSAPITVFRFMKVMFENHRVLDDGESFNVEDYQSYDLEYGDKTILEI